MTSDQKSAAPRDEERVLDRETFAFGYILPEGLKSKRGVTPLVRSELMVAAVQLFTKGGGERNVHSHDALDGFWFVLSGRALFYDLEDKVIGDLGRHQGIFIPRNAAYWFECAGDEPLEILQVEAIDRSVPNKVKFYRPGERFSIERYDRDGKFLNEVTVEPSAHFDSNL